MPKLSPEDLNAALGAEEREQREESATRRLLKQARAQNAELEAKVDLLTAIDGIGCTPPDWTLPPKSTKQRRGIVNLLLSDLHLDEIVSPEQVSGRNAYDRRIAELRLKATVQRTIRLARDHVTGLTYEGIVVWLAGDNISGVIHDELKQTNAGQGVADTIDYWASPLAAALGALAEHFGKVTVVSVPGNHPRASRKPEAKNAVRSSFDWLLTRTLWRELKSDSRIAWVIPEATMVNVPVYGTVYHFEHGDDFQGGDQIAGPIRPVLMGYFRRLAQGAPFDVMLVGHFHQYAAIPQAVMNGSMIGYNEYAARRGFRFEPPKQAWWVETPENGPMFHTAVLPCDPVGEGWG